MGKADSHGTNNFAEDPAPEATWGADPLEYYGGFRSLRYDAESQFASSIAPGGKVAWSSMNASSLKSNEEGSLLKLTARFPEVDWTSLRSIYGWAAIQYQVWARGNLTVEGHSTQTVALYTENLLEFWLDNEPYFGGDFYGYRRAPVILHLDPGAHVLDIRMVRDVRAMGGQDVVPAISICLDARLSDGKLAIADNQILVPDIVGGRLASPYGSLSVRNEGVDVIDIRSIESIEVRKNETCLQLEIS